MRKLLIVSLSLIVFNDLNISLAFADSDILKTTSKASLSASSMAVGTVLGTPIAIVRKTGNEYMSCVKEFKKDSNTYKFWGAAYSAPVAVVSGLIKGPINGAKNAVRYSVNKPFGKDSFSLGNLENNTSTNTETNTQSDTNHPENQPWGSPR